MFSKMVRKTGYAAFWGVSISRVMSWVDIDIPDEIIKLAGETPLRETPNQIKTL